MNYCPITQSDYVLVLELAWNVYSVHSKYIRLVISYKYCLQDFQLYSKIILDTSLSLSLSFICTPTCTHTHTHTCTQYPDLYMHTHIHAMIFTCTHTHLHSLINFVIPSTPSPLLVLELYSAELFSCMSVSVYTQFYVHPGLSG